MFLECKVCQYHSVGGIFYQASLSFESSCPLVSLHLLSFTRDTAREFIVLIVIPLFSVDDVSGLPVL